MKAAFDIKSFLPKLEISEKDLADANAINVMMQTAGWKVLQNYWAVAREALIERIKKPATTNAEMNKTALAGQVLNGFDECIIIPQRIVTRIIDMNEQMEKEEDINGNEPD